MVGIKEWNYCTSLNMKGKKNEYILVHKNFWFFQLVCFYNSFYSVTINVDKV